MSSENRAKRGADPYPDEAETAARSGIINFQLNNTDYAAATLQNFIAPCDGYVRGIGLITQVLSAGAGVLTLTGPGGTLTTIAVPDATAVGTKFQKRIQDSAANRTSTNYVKKGDTITLQSDATPTAGAFNGYIHIDAGPRSQLGT
jgi:hypothetical protein